MLQLKTYKISLVRLTALCCFTIMFFLLVRPHVIICDLHRSRVDVNREVNEATFGMSNAKIVYDEYHDFIHRAIVNSSNSGSRNVFYIDIHGQVLL